MEESGMPKIKTNRGAAKRFKKTGTGKIKRSHAFTSHILTSKTRKRKRNLRKSSIVTAVDHKNILRLIPYM
jgi:large subunit ribosomal protein L35